MQYLCLNLSGLKILYIKKSKIRAFLQQIMFSFSFVSSIWESISFIILKGII